MRTGQHRRGLPWVVCALLALGGCADDPSSSNNKPDQGPGDMMVPLDMPPDMPSAACNSTDDCTGPFANFECVDGMCADCDAGDDGCVCRANGTCTMGNRCDAEQGLCVPCVEGQLDCPCSMASAACDEGLACVQGTCVTDPCTEGALDCPCSPGDTCDDALYCDDMSVCRACTSDIEGCSCEQDGTCAGAELYCEAGRCETCPERDRPESCACTSQLDCAVGLSCDADSGRCRATKTCAELCLAFQLCDESGAGDPVCVPGSCVAGYVWNGSMCAPETAVETCDGAGGTTDKTPECLMQGKVCVDPPGSAAACVDTCAGIAATCAASERLCTPHTSTTGASCGACRPGFVDDGSGACVPNTSASCTPGAPDSILMACQSANRTCQDIPAGGAMCGDCAAGFVLSVTTGACVADTPCGGQLCGQDEFCEYPQTGGPPRCKTRACPSGQALNESTGACVACSLTCDAEGVYPKTIGGACACASEVFCSYQFDGGGDRCFKAPCPAGQAQSPGGQCVSCPAQCDGSGGRTTRAWPTTTVDGSCFCETQEGYYFPFGGASLPKQCDLDGDGWINRTAMSTYQTASNINMGPIQRDDAVLGNFRCELRRIDRMTLRNEWGQQRHVSLCGDTLIDYAPGQTPTCNAPDELKVLRLFEPDVLDDNAQILTDTTSFPAYGSRRLTASELNPLTKACVTQTADYNLNGVEDLREQHALEKTRIPGLTFAGDTADDEFFFHSFAYFAELHQGLYVPPANYALPGRYVIAERSRCDTDDFALGYSTGPGYWQQCTRDRRGDYDRSGDQNGHDFAAWGCTGQTGSCGIKAPPADSSLDNTDGDNVPDHGLCQRADPMPNTPWRGMTHHSQFQCVVLKTTPDPTKPHELATADIYRAGEASPTLYEFNRCNATTCGAGSPAGCQESSGQGVAQPRVTELDCQRAERDAVAQDEVGWVALRYTPEGSTVSLTRPYVRGCIDESYGTDSTDAWSALCPGYTKNPAGVLTAGNPGDYGKLICSCNRFFGGSDCSVSCVERSTGALGTPTSFLHVGDRDRGYAAEQYASYACSPDDRYCSLHPPVSSEGFAGGRRGYWMCGETSLTRTVDDTGQDVPSLSASANIGGTNRTYSLQGKIRIAPVHRKLLAQPMCTTNCYSAF